MAFRPGQHIIGPGDEPRCNVATGASIEMILCAAGEQHLAHTLPPHLVHHHITTLQPRRLRFACPALLRDNAGRFDWFGYLEDDCEITNAVFFAKRAWFNAQFGPNALLQPNRFERSAGPVVQKLYIDGRLKEAAPMRRLAPCSASIRRRSSAPGSRLQPFRSRGTSPYTSRRWRMPGF